MKTDAFRQIADDLDKLGETVSDHASRGGMLHDDTLFLAYEMHSTARMLRRATNAAVEDYARAYSGRAKREDAA